MKKLFFTAFFSAILLVNAQDTQNSQNSSVKFGVKVGMNFSSLYGDMSSASIRPGMYAGVYARIPVAEKFSIQPEVLYSMQGADSDNYYYWGGYWYYDSGSDQKYELDYINVPIMVQYEIIKGLRAELGPQFSFAVYKKHKYRYVDYNSNYNYQSSDKDLNSFDVGLNMGVNYELPNGINFAARYSLGFINVNDSDYYSGYDIRNQVFSAGVGFTF